MKTFLCSKIVGWIELFVIFMGLLCFGIELNLLKESGFDWAYDVTRVMFILGVAYYWGRMVDRRMTFGYMADVSWLIALIIAGCFLQLSRMEIVAVILGAVGIVIDILRTYAFSVVQDDCLTKRPV